MSIAHKKATIILSVSLAFLLVVILGSRFLNLSLSDTVSQENETSNTYILPTYSPFEIQTFCEILSIETHNSFCSSITAQNADTLETTLGRLFPIGTTDYFDFVPLMSGIASRPSHFCNQSPIANSQGYALNNCPPPSECTQDYQCTFSLFFDYDIDVSITVGIDVETGNVQYYGVTRPSASQ